MKVDLSDHYCPNSGCEKYGIRDKGNIIFVREYGKHGQKLLKCDVCEKTFSDRRGTIFWGKTHSEETILRVLKCLCEGNGIRATERITGVTQKTIISWLNEAALHCKEVSDYLVCNLHLTEAQLDEFWSFVKKRRRN